MALLQNILLIFSCIMLFVLATSAGSKFSAVGAPSLFAMIVFYTVWVIGDLIEVNTSTFQLMLCVGIAGCNVQDSFLTELLHKADLALYQSKQQGKNRVRQYGSEVPILG